MATVTDSGLESSLAARFGIDLDTGFSQKRSTADTAKYGSLKYLIPFGHPSHMLSHFKPFYDLLPEGWFATPNERSDLLGAELQRELPPGHILDGVPVTVVAHRDGTDDILCWHRDFPQTFTVIHLSWLGRTEIDVNHPTVEFVGSFDEFLVYDRRFYA